jgi:hypothetical protein
MLSALNGLFQLSTLKRRSTSPARATRIAT